jgi:DNA-binding transcriptional MerR regulator
VTSQERGLPIGGALARLQPDFPDLSISKIRFLEGQGLVTPSRTGSGYRTFTEEDVARLRFALTAQRDRFWPLRVIREALEAMDRGLEPPDPATPARATVPEPAADGNLPAPADLRPHRGLRLTREEVRDAAEVDEQTFAALVSFGLLRPGPDGYFDEQALAIARAAGELTAYGIEARHLRPFRLAADREIGLVQQALGARRGPSRDEEATEVLHHCLALHAALVRAGLSED